MIRCDFNKKYYGATLNSVYAVPERIASSPILWCGIISSGSSEIENHSISSMRCGSRIAGEFIKFSKIPKYIIFVHWTVCVITIVSLWMARGSARTPTSSRVSRRAHSRKSSPSSIFPHGNSQYPGQVSTSRLRRISKTWEPCLQIILPDAGRSVRDIKKIKTKKIKLHWRNQSIIPPSYIKSYPRFRLSVSALSMFSVFIRGL